MKNCIQFATLFAAIVLFAFPSSAQKKVKKAAGTITYSIESVGEIPIPLDRAEISYKVMDNSLKCDATNLIVKDMVLYYILDFTPIQRQIEMGGIEFDYDGPWKGYLKREMTQNELDKIDSNADYKIEYLSDSKELLGFTAKKAILHMKIGEEIKDFEIWYTDAIGPDVDFVQISGLRGFPLEYTQFLGENMELKYTVKNFKKEKLKEVNFLMPAGFDEIPYAKYEEFIAKYQELMESMQ